MKWGEVATLMKSVMDKCRRISDDSGKTAGGAVLRQKGNCGSTLYVGKQLKNYESDVVGTHLTLVITHTKVLSTTA